MRCCQLPSSAAKCAMKCHLFSFHQLTFRFSQQQLSNERKMWAEQFRIVLNIFKRWLPHRPSFEYSGSRGSSQAPLVNYARGLCNWIIENSEWIVSYTKARGAKIECLFGMFLMKIVARARIRPHPELDCLHALEVLKKASKSVSNPWKLICESETPDRSGFRCEAASWELLNADRIIKSRPNSTDSF